MRSILWHLKLIPGTGIGRDYFIAEKQSPVPVNVHMVGIILVNAAKPVIFSVNPAYYGVSNVPMPGRSARTKGPNCRNQKQAKPYTQRQMPCFPLFKHAQISLHPPLFRFPVIRLSRFLNGSFLFPSTVSKFLTVIHLTIYRGREKPCCCLLKMRDLRGYNPNRTWIRFLRKK